MPFKIHEAQDYLIDAAQLLQHKPDPLNCLHFNTQEHKDASSPAVGRRGLARLNAPSSASESFSSFVVPSACTNNNPNLVDWVLQGRAVIAQTAYVSQARSAMP